MTAKGVEQWIDRNHSTMAWIILMTALAMLLRVTEWSLAFAASSVRTGVEIASITAAVQVPATYYAGWAFKTFAEMIKS